MYRQTCMTKDRAGVGYVYVSSAVLLRAYSSQTPFVVD